MQDSLLTLMLQSVAGLAVVLALFGLLVWMLKRLQQKRLGLGDTSGIRIVQRCAIDTRHNVIKMTHGQDSYLLGLSPSGITLIDKLVTDGKKKTTFCDARE